MTSIAFKEGVMAADSRSSVDDMHMTNCKKLFRLEGGAILGGAGDDDDRDVQLMLANCRTKEDLPSRSELIETGSDFLGLLLLPDQTLWRIEIEWLEHDHEGERIASVSQIQGYAAVGSGSVFAYGAMDVGAGAVEAVKAACKRDLYSAGPVRQMSL